MKTGRRGLILVSAASAVLWLGGSPILEAKRPGVTLSEPAYREMRRLAERLDAKARHAADQAAHDQYRIYRRDNGFVRAVLDFARRAGQFNQRMAGYRARPWQVDDDLRSLLRSARDVQDRVRRSRSVDEHTLSDWNEVVDSLNRMVKLSQSRDGLIGSGEYPGPEGGSTPPRVYEGDPREMPAPPSDHDRDEYGERRVAPGRGGFRDIAGLARELEDRAARAHETAQRVAAENGPYRREFFQSIRDFHDQAAAFREQVESGAIDRGQIRAEAGRLSDFARQADQRMRQANAFREVWQEWQGVIGVLQRILSLAGA